MSAVQPAVMISQEPVINDSLAREQEGSELQVALSQLTTLSEPKVNQTILKFFGANLVGRGIAATLAELEEKIARHADDHFLAIQSCSITVDNETGQRPYYIAAVVFQKLS